MQEDNNLDVTLSEEQEKRLQDIFKISKDKQIATMQISSTFNQAKLKAQLANKNISLWAKYKRLISKVVEFLTK